MATAGMSMVLLAATATASPLPRLAGPQLQVFEAFARHYRGNADTLPCFRKRISGEPRHYEHRQYAAPGRGFLALREQDARRFADRDLPPSPLWRFGDGYLCLSVFLPRVSGRLASVEIDYPQAPGPIWSVHRLRLIRHRWRVVQDVGPSIE